MEELQRLGYASHFDLSVIAQRQSDVLDILAPALRTRDGSSDQVHAARQLQDLIRLPLSPTLQKRNMQLLGSHDGILQALAHVVSSSSSSDEEAKQAAAMCMLHLSQADEVYRERIAGQGGAISSLVALLHARNSHTVQLSCNALRELVIRSCRHQRTAADAGAVRALVQCLRPCSSSGGGPAASSRVQQVAAATALSALVAGNPRNQDMAAQANNALHYLLDLLGHQQTSTAAAAALATICADNSRAQNQLAFHPGALEQLAALLDTSQPAKVQCSAAGVLYAIALDNHANRQLIRTQPGVLTALAALLTAGQGSGAHGGGSDVHAAAAQLLQTLRHVTDVGSIHTSSPPTATGNNAVPGQQQEGGINDGRVNMTRCWKWW